MAEVMLNVRDAYSSILLFKTRIKTLWITWFGQKCTVTTAFKYKGI